MSTKNYLKIKKLIDEADAILIGAGAGLSSSAGIDYSKESFKKFFPELVKAYNMTDMYSSSFYNFKTEEERWSYWAKHINYSYTGREALNTYKNLFKMIKNKNYFVITTNVDGQFVKSGFDKEKVFEIQGNYGKIQCSVSCHNKTYDNTKIIKEMLLSKDNLKIDSSLLPICPVCHEKMDINIRKDMFFVEDDNWHKLNKNYKRFINENINKKLLLIELGVGFNTPGIIRFPFNQLFLEHINITLIRVNKNLDEEDSNQFYFIKEDCDKFIKNILNIRDK